MRRVTLQDVINANQERRARTAVQEYQAQQRLNAERIRRVHAASLPRPRPVAE
jgi:hypothetical protein